MSLARRIRRERFLPYAHARFGLSCRIESVLLDAHREVDDPAVGAAGDRHHVDAADAQSGRPVASFEERVRLYSADEVDALLEEAGFTLRGERMGDVHGAPFNAEAARYVRVAERS